MPFEKRGHELWCLWVHLDLIRFAPECAVPDGYHGDLPAPVSWARLEASL